MRKNGDFRFILYKEVRRGAKGQDATQWQGHNDPCFVATLLPCPLERRTALLPQLLPPVRHESLPCMHRLQNVDSNAAIALLARLLGPRAKTNVFSLAGTKDKRGCTTQVTPSARLPPPPPPLPSSPLTSPSVPFDPSPFRLPRSSPLPTWSPQSASPE